MKNEMGRINFPENWSAKAVEITKNSDPTIFNEIWEFLTDMKDGMGIFTHLQKYFSHEEFGKGRILESAFWDREGARYLSVIKYEDEKAKADILGIVVLVSDDANKQVDCGIYLEPAAQGRGIAGKYCVPEIQRLFQKHFIDKGKNYKLVVSNITPQAKKCC